mgnify:CR=1 FL=1
MQTREITPTRHSRKLTEKRSAWWRTSLYKMLARLDGRTVARHVFLTAAGVLLYKLGAICALRERGYFAVGGEALALLLPVFYYCAAAIIRDIARDAKDRWNKW